MALCRSRLKRWREGYVPATSIPEKLVTAGQRTATHFTGQTMLPTDHARVSKPAASQSSSWPKGGHQEVEELTPKVSSRLQTWKAK